MVHDGVEKGHTFSNVRMDTAKAPIDSIPERITRVHRHRLEILGERAIHENE
jgi:CRISPR/Cas system-associated endonuclease/helicase Cas3